MTTFRTLATLLALLTTAACSSVERGEVEAAADTYYPGAKWRESSVLKGDFSCQGKSDVAILGASRQFIVVAIFTNGLNVDPQVLEYAARVREPEAVTLGTWSLDLTPEELKAAPEGFTPSKACSGLNLSDGDVNLGLIYWNAMHKRFQDWAR
jgi:hypothetical protein